MSPRRAAVATLVTALALPMVGPPGPEGAYAERLVRPDRLAQLRPLEGRDDGIREPGGLPGRAREAEPGSAPRVSRGVRPAKKTAPKDAKEKADQGKKQGQP